MKRMKRNTLWILLAPFFGLAAMILPVLVMRPAHWYDAPLFPVIRNAQERFGLWQLVLFFVVGVVLGLLSSSRALLLGATAVVLLPLAALAEVVADPTSHNLWPIEFMFYAFYGLIVATGAALSHQAVRRFMGRTNGA
jgi:hypothetical protein